MSFPNMGLWARARRVFPKALALCLCALFVYGPAALAQQAQSLGAPSAQTTPPAAASGPMLAAGTAEADKPQATEPSAAPQQAPSAAVPSPAPSPSATPQAASTAPASGDTPAQPQQPATAAANIKAQAQMAPAQTPAQDQAQSPAPAQAQSSAPVSAQTPSAVQTPAPSAVQNAVQASPAREPQTVAPSAAPAPASATQPAQAAPKAPRPQVQAQSRPVPAAVPASADASRLRSAAKGAPRVNVPFGKSIIQPTTAEISRVAVSNPDVADFVQVSSRQIYITGKAVGLTTMTLWDDEDRIRAIFDIEVSPDLTRLKKVLHDVMPSESTIEISSAQDRIALSGQIKNAENIPKAVALAEAFAPGKVLNLMQLGGVQQVMLEVRVAEMSRNLLRHMGINLNHIFQGDFVYTMLGGLTSQASISNILNDQTQGTRGGAKYPIRWNTQTPQYGISPNVNAMVNLNSPFGRSQGTWTAFIDMLKDNGLVKILAEPTVVCLNGEKADFLAGGEIPVPIPQSLGAVTIEWKRFGVELGFRPTVLSGDRISLQVAPSVSDLDFTRAVQVGGSLVPALNKRAASTTVELGDGQSFAIAGLMREDARDSVNKYPALGDIPVLGALFKSQEYQKSQTELVIIITPHLAKPMDKSITRLPTDAMTNPSDADFYLNLRGIKDLMGSDQDKKASQSGKSQPASGGRGSMDGEFGLSVPEGRLNGSNKARD